MRPESPRKSSTSSGRAPRRRARYLGVEVAGEPLPSLSPARWESWLRGGLADPTSVPFRLVRFEGPRAIVEVGRRDVAAARAAWNGPRAVGPGLRLRTQRTWGTLLGAKAWAARTSGARPRDASARAR